MAAASRRASSRRPWPLTLAWWRRPSPPPQLTTARTTSEVGGSAATAASMVRRRPIRRSTITWLRGRRAARGGRDGALSSAPRAVPRRRRGRARLVDPFRLPRRARRRHALRPAPTSSSILTPTRIRCDHGSITRRGTSGWPLSPRPPPVCRARLRHLVVVDPRAGGTPVGIVTRHDLCERCTDGWQRADDADGDALARRAAAEATEGGLGAELRARESELGTTRTVGAARC